jgi:hypothetical protein
MKLGDQACWLVQDDWNGGLLTSIRAANVVVAAAAFGELVAVRAVDVRPAGVVGHEPVAPVDELGFEVDAPIATTPGVTAGEVNGGLAPPIRNRVARRPQLAAWKKISRNGEAGNSCVEHSFRAAAAQQGGSR